MLYNLLMHKVLLLISSLFCVPVSAQDKIRPDGFLPTDFHQERREALRANMPENSVAVFFANPVRNRANDVSYVHDLGTYDTLQSNMVITIEDDFLITEEGCELLSDMAPRKSEEIEALMQESSPFDPIILPDLEGK